MVEQVRAGRHRCTERACIVPMLSQIEVCHDGRRHFAWLGCIASSGRRSPRPRRLPTAARIESVPLELTMPERYQSPRFSSRFARSRWSPPGDGLIRSIEARLGAVVRETEEIAQLDRTEAAARLKMATAELHEKQALLKANKNDLRRLPGAGRGGRGASRAGPARARPLHAASPLLGPRGRDANVCTGQYVLKGTVIAELADVSSLKVMQPVDRRSVTANSSLTVQVEGRDVPAKVQAVLPLAREPEGPA